MWMDLSSVQGQHNFSNIQNWIVVKLPGCESWQLLKCQQLALLVFFGYFPEDKVVSSLETTFSF